MVSSSAVSAVKVSPPLVRAITSRASRLAPGPSVPSATCPTTTVKTGTARERARSAASSGERLTARVAAIREQHRCGRGLLRVPADLLDGVEGHGEAVADDASRETS